MSELAMTLLRFGFLAGLWIAIFLALNLMRRDLNRSERRRTPRTTGIRVALPTAANRKSKINRVVVVTDAGEVGSFQLENGMRIGRLDSNQVQISDEYASSVHAEIGMDEDGWFYTDLGSTNGSWIDRKRIDSPVRLKSGSEIRINQTRLRFEK